MKENKLVIIAGLARSGKDAMADYLCGKHGFKKFVMSDALINEMKKQNMETDKKTISEFGDSLREKDGMGAVAKLVMKRIEEENPEKIVIVGPRSVEEIEIFKENFSDVEIVKIESDKSKRFERKSAEDPQDEKSFFGRDERDVKNKGLEKVLRMADKTIENNGTLEELYRKADELIAE